MLNSFNFIIRIFSSICLWFSFYKCYLVDFKPFIMRRLVATEIRFKRFSTLLPLRNVYHAETSATEDAHSSQYLILWSKESLKFWKLILFDFLAPIVYISQILTYFLMVWFLSWLAISRVFLGQSVVDFSDYYLMFGGR